MRGKRIARALKFLATGALLFQASACDFNLAAANIAAQTVLLGVTAAGAIAIIENI
ncbi:MAG: hypothetical protein HY287_04805 [Planctomycetes bacterium]|nr:hypothetical protein [Planctomycetota bacterium]MBI3833633.1 hypothetical protein [Planctomycetota bacterium]